MRHGVMRLSTACDEVASQRVVRRTRERSLLPVRVAADQLTFLSSLFSRALSSLSENVLIII